MKTSLRKFNDTLYVRIPASLLQVHGLKIEPQEDGADIDYDPKKKELTVKI